MTRRQLRREIKELKERVAQLENKYLDLYGQVILLKSEFEEAIMEGANYTIAERKLRRLTRS
ncbi:MULTISPECIES: hypothetical protein [Metallosphaera]|uniref:Uncharacterized protein n=2 Tax=Metallosphaera TaxID=41980 RepID=A0A0K1STB4_9CREN|nr:MULTISPECIES: hypothetical protein [Metallosphaera]AKV73318.1 hypothetical protein MsedA_0147 [Metallosphaera sedula]AKV75562.1 hypothetical protein MsedB_0147 [Metallosphaera sedula]AKV77808.1 hypothetical protein MsedC_0146 [Metallosphaera sedula]AKV80053.1 hypothetical protein MsedD_0147 [Metallosphaera sedula]AKV82296.1 hypothetical protein MsedE_0147 [Metallosphaera sedula]